jgi:hypothetical protein
MLFCREFPRACGRVPFIQGGFQMDEEEEMLQVLQKNLTQFGKQNTQRFRILEDLTLSCELCKTPEAKTSIREMTRKYFDELKREQGSLNTRIQNMLKKTKDFQKKKPSKDFGKKVAKMIDKFTSVHVGKNGKLKVKFKSVKELPELEFFLKF